MNKTRRGLQLPLEAQTVDTNATLSEAARLKFTGNTSFYIYQARHRQRVFLPRNINAVLEENSVAAARDKRLLPGRNTPTEISLDNSELILVGRCRQRIGIHEAIHKIKPALKAGGVNEQILKIEAKSLKRKRFYRPRQTTSGSGSSGLPMESSAQNTGVTIADCSPKAKPGLVDQNGLAKNEGPMSFRCRCEINISEKVDATVRKHKSRRRPLYSDTEMCTITLDSDDTATIHMDDPFIVKVSKLFVMTSRSASKDFMLAESYTATFALQPTDPNSPWPPLLHNHDTLQTVGDLLSVQLVTDITSLPLVPTTPWHEMSIEIGEQVERAHLSIELECGWSVPTPLGLRVNSNRDVHPTRLPTPLSEQGRELSHSTQNALTSYYFSMTLDNKYYSSFGEPNHRGQHSFSVPKFACPFCDGREFKTSHFLHFHLVTAHEMFTFKVKQRKPSSGIRGGEDANYDLILDIIVDLSKETMINRASDHVPDIRTFQWIRPAKRFDVNRIAKGDWSWLNEKKSLSSGGYRRGTSDEPSKPMPKVIDLYKVEPIPPKPRRKMIVPEPKTVLEGPVFVRSKSKRFVSPGEVLSESDDDVDEEWIKMRHNETIDDFTDVGRDESTFMKLWDNHMFKERPIGYVHMPHVCIRFATEHAEYLRRSNLLVEFWKHMLNQIQYGIIDTAVLVRCMEIVKGGSTEWSSVEKSPWGVGLQGGLPLDKVQAPPTSPTPMRRRKSTRRSKGKGLAIEDDKMDIDSSPDNDSPGKRDPEDSQKIIPDPFQTAPLNSGFCICNRGWRRADMIMCDGKDCASRWFHRSCVKRTSRWQSSWLCQKCIDL